MEESAYEKVAKQRISREPLIETLAPATFCVQQLFSSVVIKVDSM